MRIVLPPSETKTPGGQSGSTLDWAALALPRLTATRQAIASDLAVLCRDEQAAAKALGLGPKSLSDIADNLQLESSPVMPAIERYTGVLFDALDYGSLGTEVAARADQTVWLFSALFGPLRATDLIPRYRLSFDSKVPGVPLKNRWLPHTDDIWAGEFSVDLRSEGYRALAPLPAGAGVFVKVVKSVEGAAAVGHANKGTKGRFVRQMVTDAVTVTSAAELVAWGARHGYTMAASPEGPDEVLLAVAS